MSNSTIERTQDSSFKEAVVTSNRGETQGFGVVRRVPLEHITGQEYESDNT